MNVARTVWLDHAPERSRVARMQTSGGLLGIILLCMLCAAETSWLMGGGPDASHIVAAAEGIYILD